MADMHTPLLPCPHCGSDDVRRETDLDGKAYPICVDCGASTPDMASWLARSSQDAETIKALGELVSEGVNVSRNLAALVGELANRLDANGIENPDVETAEAHFEIFERVERFQARAALAGSAS